MLFTRHLVLLACAVALAGCDRHSSHDHEHDEGPGHHHPHAEGEQLEPVALTVFTPRVGLFMQHPPLVAGVQARFLAHLTVLATGEPVRAGRLSIQYVAPDGTRGAFVAERPSRDGLFTPQGRLTAPGRYKAQLVLESPGVSETVDLGELVVYADESSAHAAGHAEDHAEPADAVPFPMEQQWKMRMLLAVAAPRPMTQRLQTLARIETPPDAEALVSTHVTGHLKRPPAATLPRLGDAVTAGQVVGIVEMELPATEAATLAADRATARAASVELTLRGLELEARLLEARGNVSQAAARLEQARKTFERLSLLRGRQLSTEEEFERAQADLKVAEAAAQSTAALVTAYEQATRKTEALRDNLGGSDDDLNRPLRMPLEAPIGGQIVESHHVEGEHIDAHAGVYRIIDTSRVWAVAQLSEFDLPRVKPEAGGLLTLDAQHAQPLDITEAGGKLINVGVIVDSQTRTLPVRFELPNPAGLLRAGMSGKLELEVGRVADALAVPEEAVVYDNGRPIVFVLLEGELFGRREVELGLRDGGFVQITRGVSAGERVATRGAYAVKLAAAAPAGFGEGHVH